jgi:pilus assembly protein Flp/PilA
MSIRSLIKRRSKNDEGVTLVEYALLLALIAVVCITVVALVGKSASNVLHSAAASI